MQLSESTADLYARKIAQFQKFIHKPSLQSVNQHDIRRYFKYLTEYGQHSTYRNTLAAFRRLFRDYLKLKHVVADFKFPRQSFKPKTVPSKQQMKAFYQALKRPRHRALFLMLASSGLRHSEMLSLKFSDIKCKDRMICPSQNAPNQSKHVWVSFYNAEAEHELNRYLELRRQENDGDSRIFPIGQTYSCKVFRKASRKSGVKVTAQKLRAWFCCEMGRLSVPDRYVDAYCGRTPKSVLARHYTDYSPERLKRIYDRAGLRVLG